MAIWSGFKFGQAMQMNVSEGIKWRWKDSIISNAGSLGRNDIEMFIQMLKHA